jgi:hypothetical protein
MNVRGGSPIEPNRRQAALEYTEVRSGSLTKDLERGLCPVSDREDLFWLERFAVSNKMS